MTLVFHPLAERELIAATKFYENRAVGLGNVFLCRMESALTRIAANPALGIQFGSIKIRRHLIQGFPYGVVYEVRRHDILVLAIMNLRRRPGYWRRRICRHPSAH